MAKKKPAKKKPAKVSKLNPKQKRFCQEYVIDLNGTQAAIRAGYSARTANEQAAQLLAKLSIQAFVKKLQKGISKRLEVSADKVVQELAKIGFCNIQDYIETGNSTKDLSGIERDTAAPISSIKVTKTTGGKGEGAWEQEAVEFKLHNKVSALETLGKHLGIFEKDNSQKKPDAPQVIAPG